MSNQSSTPNDKPPTIQDIIREIEEKSANGAYIYRGENKYYEKVTSTLYRECQEVADIGMDRIQKQMLYAAEDYDINRLGQSRSQQAYWMWGGGYNPFEYTERQFEILAELQHWGGETNLIDFTTDYRVALFFACDGHYDEDGRIILQDHSRMKPIIWNPTEPTHRIEAQKSVFVRPPEGFIQPNPEDVICIPKNLKVPLLKHLVRQDPPITHKTIYNDLHGFIRLQSRYRDAVVKFYIADEYEKQGDIAKTPEARQENYREVINYYQTAIELMPNLIMAHIRCGIVYGKKLEDFDAAIACFNEALDWEPDNGMAYCNRGAAYGNIGKTDKAIEDLNKATELDPESAGAYLNRGNACFLKGDVNSAIEDFNTAIELNPNLAEAYIGRGNFYIIIGDVNSAIEDYTKAMALEPEFAEAYTVRGVAYIQKGDFDQAIQDCTQAVQLKQDYAEAYNNLGLAYESKGNFDQAIRNYSQAIEFKSDYAKAYRNRGNACFLKGEFEKAIRDHTKAIKLQTDDAEAYYNRGIVYMAKSEFDDAIKDYTQAIGLKPNFTEAYYNRGNAYKVKGDFENAVTDYSTTIELKPDDAAAYNNRGIAHKGKGDFDSAIKDHTTAIKFRPDDVITYYNRSIAYAKKGDSENAIKDYNRAIEIKVDEANAYYKRSEIWLNMRKWEKAKSDLTTAKNMGLDIIASFHNTYQSIVDFEQKTGIQLPPDIAALLTPS